MYQKKSRIHFLWCCFMVMLLTTFLRVVPATAEGADIETFEKGTSIFFEEGSEHPDSVTATLYYGGSPVESKEPIILSDVNGWSCSFTDLPLIDDDYYNYAIYLNGLEEYALLDYSSSFGTWGVPECDVTYLSGTNETASNIPEGETHTNGSPYTVSLETPQREGYEFIDWTLNYTTHNITKIYTSETWAKGKLVRYMIEYVAENNALHEYNSMHYGVTGKTVKAEAEQIDGYVLTGDAVKEIILDEDELKNYIYFYYTKEEPQTEPVYHVYYDAGFGVGEVPVDSNDYHAGDEVVVMDCDTLSYTAAEYVTFSGAWSMNRLDYNDSYDSDDLMNNELRAGTTFTMPEGDVILYARYFY